MRNNFFFFFLLSSNLITSQFLFDQDTYKGGVTSITLGNMRGGGEGSYSFDSHVPLGSTIREVYAVICFSRKGNTENSLEVKVNNNSLVFTDDDRVTNEFFGYEVSNVLFNSSIRIKKVTDLFDAGTLTYQIKFPQNLDYYSKGNFSSLTFYIKYNNVSFPLVCSEFFLNNIDSDTTITSSLEGVNSINSFYPASLSIVSSFVCDTVIDGSFISVNNYQIGLIGGTDANTNNMCSGVYGCFAHYNNISFGLDDDTPDSLMRGTDALADVKSYLNNNDTVITLKSAYQSPNLSFGRPLTNPIRYLFLAHSTNCDTLHSYLTTADTTICAGEVLNLAVGGDSTYTYAWRYRGNVVSTDSILNITPNENRLYSIMVSDTNGCSKTEIINIKVNPKPKVFISTQDALCPNNNGAIIIDSVQGIAAPYRYRKNFGPWQTAPVYGSLFAGEYNISVADTNGCITTKTITINDVNNTIANFSYETPLPFMPTTIDFTNQSQNASEYQWLVNGALVNNSTNLTHFFEGVGDYQLSLVAAKQNEQCTDTLTKTINLERDNYIYVPSNWGEESPLALYSLGYLQLEFRLLNGLGQVVHVLSIPITSEEQFLIGNKNLARGIYFYELKATKVTGEKVALGGKVIRL